MKQGSVYKTFPCANLNAFFSSGCDFGNQVLTSESHKEKCRVPPFACRGTTVSMGTGAGLQLGPGLSGHICFGSSVNYYDVLLIITLALQRKQETTHTHTLLVSFGLDQHLCLVLHSWASGHLFGLSPGAGASPSNPGSGPDVSLSAPLLWKPPARCPHLFLGLLLTVIWLECTHWTSPHPPRYSTRLTPPRILRAQPPMSME